jgi:hypothetical protein
MEAHEIAQWNDTITHIAQRWVHQWAWRQHQEPLVEDLRSAGWIALMTFGPDHPRVRWEIQNGMQETLSLWLYGVGRRSRRQERRISWGPTQEIPWDRTREHTGQSVAHTAVRRVGIERLWHKLGIRGRCGRPSKSQTVLRLLLDDWPSSTITRRASQQADVGDRALFNGKRKIYRIAKELDLEE